MVKNKALDTIKTEKNRNRIREGIKKLLPSAVRNHAEQHLTEENFKTLLDCLPEKEKRIVLLSMEGYTIEEISKQEHLTEKTISNLLAMARKKVKELWKTFMEY